MPRIIAIKLHKFGSRRKDYYAKAGRVLRISYLPLPITAKSPGNLAFRQIVILALPIAVILLLLGHSFVVTAFSGLPSAPVTSKTSEGGYEVYAQNPGSFAKIQAKWNVPTLTCAARSNAYAYLDIVIGHLIPGDSGSSLYMSCSPSPHYYITYDGNGIMTQPLPSNDKVFAGDKMKTIATLSLLGGETSVYIQDYTQNWSFGVSGAESIDTSKPAWVFWGIWGTGTSGYPLIHFSTIHMNGASATLGSVAATVGGFSAQSGFTMYKFVFTDYQNGHVLARPTVYHHYFHEFCSKLDQGI